MSDTEDLSQLFTELSERICIPKFDYPIKGMETPTYATKTSTVVLIDHDNHVTFVERDWHDENMSPINPSEYKDILHHFDLE